MVNLKHLLKIVVAAIAAAVLEHFTQTGNHDNKHNN